MKWNKYIRWINDSFELCRRGTDGGLYRSFIGRSMTVLTNILFKWSGNHPHFRASHWSRAQNRAFLLVKRSVYEKSKGIPFHFFVTSELSLTDQWLLCIRGGKSQKKCHWSVNDTSRIMGGVSQKKCHWPVNDSSRIMGGELQKKCHWPVNDSFVLGVGNRRKSVIDWSMTVSY